MVYAVMSMQFQSCVNNKIPLIVDEAHGAHFGFHPQLPISALAQGADLVVQSTHKVLCSLTQSSMLHVSGNIVDREKICRCLQTLQSSSPSYLLLASLDAARAQLSDNHGTIFNQAIELALEAKGFEADNILYRDFGLKYLSATFLPADGSVIRSDDVVNLAVFDDVNMVLSPRDAFFARKRKVSIEESLGEICGELICPYPPGIPVLVPGEVITERALQYLLHVKSKGATISGAADRYLSTGVTGLPCGLVKLNSVICTAISQMSNLGKIECIETYTGSNIGLRTLVLVVVDMLFQSRCPVSWWIIFRGEFLDRPYISRTYLALISKPVIWYKLQGKHKDRAHVLADDSSPLSNKSYDSAAESSLYYKAAEMYTYSINFAIMTVELADDSSIILHGCSWQLTCLPRPTPHARGI
ncbi:UNVERIFIED_CONTAM: Arginine decarboxylase [Sesamum calycinum]|uniref:Arginine decarboxylase n=1 Tax=Sesamum calycinum TaxID=2727403 RepID=A0AAW2MZK8_9LAMI